MSFSTSSSVPISVLILRRIARAIRLEGGSSVLWRLLRDAAARLLRMRAERADRFTPQDEGCGVFYVS
jgi:hypothetical protein